eukprot:CAMPEP_0175502544 /NCGR_PEP_ID=MMETSP0096-20121207/7380_1 /TAXON_ID=311494 /ORGANISM="Alexandrium monilatum, Strain CCMP3105" /LENGTH=331 /DNA_ID=CAMNT_0016804597 /DNA_START=50 /DNA_END=1046 /DNA_ORIENTATION=-
MPRRPFCSSTRGAMRSVSDSIPGMPGTVLGEPIGRWFRLPAHEGGALHEGDDAAGELVGLLEEVPVRAAHVVKKLRPAAQRGGHVVAAARGGHEVWRAGDYQRRRPNLGQAPGDPVPAERLGVAAVAGEVGVVPEHVPHVLHRYRGDQVAPEDPEGAAHEALQRCRVADHPLVDRAAPSVLQQHPRRHAECQRQHAGHARHRAEWLQDAVQRLAVRALDQHHGPHQLRPVQRQLQPHLHAGGPAEQRALLQTQGGREGRQVCGAPLHGDALANQGHAGELTAVLGDDEAAVAPLVREAVHGIQEGCPAGDARAEAIASSTMVLASDGPTSQ